METNIRLHLEQDRVNFDLVGEVADTETDRLSAPNWQEDWLALPRAMDDQSDLGIKIVLDVLCPSCSGSFLLDNALPGIIKLGIKLDDII